MLVLREFTVTPPACDRQRDGDNAGSRRVLLGELSLVPRGWTSKRKEATKRIPNTRVGVARRRGTFSEPEKPHR